MAYFWTSALVVALLLGDAASGCKPFGCPHMRGANAAAVRGGLRGDKLFQSQLQVGALLL
jgi:hypothetical protein